MKTNHRLRVKLIAVVLLLAPLLASCTVVTGDAAAPARNFYTPGTGLNAFLRTPVGVYLPPGWATAGFTMLGGDARFQGLVAFNSWGDPGFWATPETTASGGMSDSPQIVAGRVPPGGAYVALESVPVPVPESVNPSRTLAGDYTPHDWRLDSSSRATVIPLDRPGEALSLVVVCKADASDATVARLNELLASWYFLDK